MPVLAIAIGLTPRFSWLPLPNIRWTLGSEAQSSTSRERPYCTRLMLVCRCSHFRYRNANAALNPHESVGQGRAAEATGDAPIQDGALSRQRSAGPNAKPSTV